MCTEWGQIQDFRIRTSGRVVLYDDATTEFFLNGTGIH